MTIEIICCNDYSLQQLIQYFSDYPSNFELDDSTDNAVYVLPVDSQADLQEELQEQGFDSDPDFSAHILTAI